MKRAALAVPFHEPGLYTGDLAGGEPVSAIKDLTMIEHDWVTQAIDLDVGGQFLEFLRSQLGKKQAGRMEGELLHGLHFILALGRVDMGSRRPGSAPVGGPPDLVEVESCS